MGKSSAPKPPDPAKTAAAQTGTNVSTAIANANLNNVNQVGPQGSLTYSQTGSSSFRDPSTGKTYQIPQFTQTQTLSPEQQQLYDTGVGTQQNLANLAQNQSGFLNDYMAKPFDGSFDATEARLMELGQKRLDPVFAERKQAMEQDLANKGIAIGSKAYDTATRQFNEGQNDAYNQLVLGGNQQAFQQAQATRNQPINEITALMSGSQVSQPQFGATNQTQIPTTDYAGLVNQGYQNELGAWNQQQSQRNELMGGLFGIGSAAIMASDARVKDDIKKVGTVKGRNLYEYSYKADPKREKHFGLMAQEVEQDRPDAVINTSTGLKLVDYGKALEG